MREITFVAAIREALRNELLQDNNIFLMGEGIGPHGSAFKQTLGLWQEFGDERVRDTPISESAFTGLAVGAAACGLRPVVDLMWIDFFAVAMDQIINEAAKLKYMSGGTLKVPLVLRANCGALNSNGPHHSQSLHAWFMHIPGLKVIMPSTPYDAKGLLISAIRDDSPVIYLEHKALYNLRGDVPEEEYSVPIGKATIRQEGKDLTIAASGLMVKRALEAANIIRRDGISIEVIDLRSLAPLDEEKILESIKKTGHLIVVDEGYKPCGLGAEISALVADRGFDYLDAPIKRVTSLHSPIGFSPVLEKYIVPDSDRIITAIKEIF